MKIKLSGNPVAFKDFTSQAAIEQQYPSFSEYSDQLRLVVSTTRAQKHRIDEVLPDGRSECASQHLISYWFDRRGDDADPMDAEKISAVTEVMANLRRARVHACAAMEVLKASQESYAGKQYIFVNETGLTTFTKMIQLRRLTPTFDTIMTQPVHLPMTDDEDFADQNLYNFAACLQLGLDAVLSGQNVCYVCDSARHRSPLMANALELLIAVLSRAFSKSEFHHLFGAFDESALSSSLFQFLGGSRKALPHILRNDHALIECFDAVLKYIFEPHAFFGGQLSYLSEQLIEVTRDGK